MAAKPKSSFEEDFRSHMAHNSLMLFLKAQTEIFINLDPKNYNEAYIRERPYLHLINTLTTGREDSPKPAFSTGKFYGLDKTTFKKNQVEHPQSYFFLGKDIDLEKATKQQKKNGYFFAFPEDLLKSWEKISLVNKNETPHSLPVRKDHAGKRFGSWKDLEQYWHPTTSLIIYDPYLLNEKASLCTNLIPMLDALISPLEACVEVLVIGADLRGRDVKRVWFNNAAEVFEELKANWKKMPAQCSLGILINDSGELKEHDRAIITPYLQIRSGDSFIYFDGTGKYLTKGTTISFHALHDPTERNTANASLKMYKEIRDRLRKQPSNRNVAGHVDNLMLDKML